MNMLSKVSHAVFLGLIAYGPLPSAFADDVKGKSRDGQLSFECLRADAPDAPTRLYIWNTDQPEVRKLAFTSRWPVVDVSVSPDAEWIALAVALAKPGKDIALLRRTSPLNYEVKLSGDGRLLRTLALRAYSEQGNEAAAYSYGVTIRNADLSVTGWAPDSTKASVSLTGTINRGTEARPDAVIWRGQLIIPSLEFISAAALR